jgi:hypothetical protein
VGRRKKFAAGEDVQFVPESVFDLRRLRDQDWRPATYVERVASMRGWHRVREPGGALTIVPSCRVRNRVTRTQGSGASLTRRRPTIDERDLSPPRGKT